MKGSLNLAMHELSFVIPSLITKQANKQYWSKSYSCFLFWLQSFSSVGGPHQVECLGHPSLAASSAAFLAVFPSKMALKYLSVRPTFPKYIWWCVHSSFRTTMCPGSVKLKLRLAMCRKSSNPSCTSAAACSTVPALSSSRWSASPLRRLFTSSLAFTAVCQRLASASSGGQ